MHNHVAAFQMRNWDSLKRKSFFIAVLFENTWKLSEVLLISPCFTFVSFRWIVFDYGLQEDVWVTVSERQYILLPQRYVARQVLPNTGFWRPGILRGFPTTTYEKYFLPVSSIFLTQKEDFSTWNMQFVFPSSARCTINSLCSQIKWWSRKYLWASPELPGT